MRARLVAPLLATIVGIAAWPSFAAHRSYDDASRRTAPLRDDARIRELTIAFEESWRARDPSDHITPRLLSAEYLQRFRERGDVGDARRAEAAARASLAVLPRANTAAQSALAAALDAQHRFREAQTTLRFALREAPTAAPLLVAAAQLELELGDVPLARALLNRARTRDPDATETVDARLAEITGDAPAARARLRHASRRFDLAYGVPNERRAWCHVRLGELAFAAGDVDGAIEEAQVALQRYPGDAQAITDLARYAAALGQWAASRDYAERAVHLLPNSEALALLADAQANAGQREEAAATQDKIVAVDRLGNTAHLGDRFLSTYFADHAIRLDRAYVLAAREVASHADPFALDALAWAAIRLGRWDAARTAVRASTRWNTADARLWYHAGLVAEHDGDRRRALDDYRRAHALNPRFRFAAG